MSEGGSDNTAVKIIAIIGGVVVVIVVSCGVLGYFGIRAMSSKITSARKNSRTWSRNIRP